MDDDKKPAKKAGPPDGKGKKTQYGNPFFNPFLDWCKAKTQEYVSEFKRIVWPSRDDLLKQTMTVIVISLIFGVYIAILDGVFNLAFTRFTAWFASTL